MTAKYFSLVLPALMLTACPSTRTSGPGRFPHLAHLAREGVSCHTCHASIVESTEVTKLNGPGYDVCAQCHKKDCGPGTKHVYSEEVTYTGAPDRKHIVFSHKDHYVRTQRQCVQCHRDVQTDVPTPGILPEMAACLQGCHRPDYDRLNCTRCHGQQDLSLLRPVTDIPHGVDYIPRHHTDAMRAKRLCMTCHTENHCTNCHDTSTGLRTELQRLDDTERTFQHRGDILTRHPIESRTNPTACARCHQPSSCDACHVRNGVSGNDRHSGAMHPPGWMGDPGNPNYHGRSARRRIIECAACHDQGPATNCIRCHRVGGYGGNPHPSGWHSSQGRSAPVCQYCHTQ
ncbi:MAG: hypothetical protein WCI05_03415 [Myxococcales bacterium]